MQGIMSINNGRNKKRKSIHCIHDFFVHRREKEPYCVKI